MTTHDILEQLQQGKLSVEEAQKALQDPGYEELGYAKLDTGRAKRTGFPEVVYCENKPDEYLPDIFIRLYEANGEVMGTRASGHQAELVQHRWDAFSMEKKEQTGLPKLSYDPVSRILKLEKPEKKRIGNIAVCCAGTADVPIAEEAAQTAEFFGSNVIRVYDAGVAGLHRLLSHMEEIRQANCVVAVAGMEGALASVLGGLVSVPILAVPTSVGYGASFNGLSALLTMINSCANGISVVNIDNGYGAGYNATLINRLAVKGQQ